jgi:hypothetical protein
VSPPFFGGDAREAGGNPVKIERRGAAVRFGRRLVRLSTGRQLTGLPQEVSDREPSMRSSNLTLGAVVNSPNQHVIPVSWRHNHWDQPEWETL